MADQVHRVAQQLEAVANRPVKLEIPNINHVMQTGFEINNTIAKLMNRIEEAQKTIGSARISVSLEKFDRWFRRFSKSQIARILLLDVIFPFLFGAMWIWLTEAKMI